MFEQVDFCVIGAGVVGSATALAIANRGQNVVLLEQFPLPHSRGNSHGQSRTFRFTYGQEIYAQFMPQSFQLWKEIEEQYGEKLLIQTGLLSIDSQPYNAIHRFKEILLKYGCKPELLGPKKLKKKYPMLRYSSQFAAILEPEGSILRADKCLLAMQKLMVDRGGKIYDGCKVKSIVPGQPCTIASNNVTLKANKVIITAGCWTPELLSTVDLELPVKTLAVTVCYWKTDDERYSHEHFPMFADATSTGSKSCSVYGLPSLEYPGLIKICRHGGVPISPDDRDKAASDTDVEFLSEYISQHLRGVESQPSIVERCMYAVTPDSEFIIDQHPKYDNIVFGVVAGHGFKMAPVLGRELCRLAMGEKSTYNMKPFLLSRFTSSASKL